MTHNTIIAFLLSFCISIFTTYNIIRISSKLHLGDAPDEARKIHLHRIPNLGGIAVFIATMIAYFSFSDFGTKFIRPDKIFTIAVFLFFMGVEDDMKPISARSRLIIEFVCTFFIIYLTDIRLTTLWGVFGIDKLPLWASYPITSVFMVGCINAYNLIDGIDGLLGSLSLLGVVCFGVIFHFTGEWLWFLLCTAIGGSLLGFLVSNWHPAKIFMGNGGSLFLGTIFACFSVHLMQLSTIPVWENLLSFPAPSTMVFAIIAMPVMDMITTFIIRLYYGGSPFEADQCHIHHRMMLLGLDQRLACVVILLLNILIILFAYFVQPAGVLKSLFFTVLFCGVLEFIIVYFSLIYHRNGKSKKNAYICGKN